MDRWQPISEPELQRIIEEQLNDCTPEQREVFERYRVSLRPAPIIRYGDVELVFIVAQRGNEVMYYEDVEHGFNFSPIDAECRILEHWCDQDELRHALWHWMDKPKQFRCGPAGPVPE